VTRDRRSESSRERFTLTDADIVSERTVTRRGLLGTLGLGAGAALTGVLGSNSVAEAADSSDKKKKSTKKPAPKKEEADSD
jgi:hypothetical protein